MVTVSISKAHNHMKGIAVKGIPKIEQPIDPRLMTLTEAGHLLGLSSVAVKARVERGILTIYKIGPKCHMVDRLEIEAVKAELKK